MKKRTRNIILVFAAAIAVVSFRAFPAIGIITHLNLRGTVTDFRELDEFLPTASPSSSRIGIPHQFFESSDFWTALLFSRRSIIHGHAFRPGEHLSKAQLEEVGNLLSDSASYETWLGEGLCGGFHADFHFRWDNSGDEAILCLGCGEVLLLHSGEKFRCVLESSVHDRLIEISKKAEQVGAGHPLHAQ